MSSVETGQITAVETEQMSAAETGQMSAAEIGQVSDVETGQMSAETGHMSAVETRQMYSIWTEQSLKTNFANHSRREFCQATPRAEFKTDAAMCTLYDAHHSLSTLEAVFTLANPSISLLSRPFYLYA